jgi:hypothetical protein
MSGSDSDVLISAVDAVLKAARDGDGESAAAAMPVLGGADTQAVECVVKYLIHEKIDNSLARLTEVTDTLGQLDAAKVPGVQFASAMVLTRFPGYPGPDIKTMLLRDADPEATVGALVLAAVLLAGTDTTVRARLTRRLRQRP